jgi:hypothetical protein
LWHIFGESVSVQVLRTLKFATYNCNSSTQYALREIGKVIEIILLWTSARNHLITDQPATQLIDWLTE